MAMVLNIIRASVE